MPFDEWLPVVSPGWDWEARHLDRIREELALVTSGACDQLMIFTPPRHMKTEHTTVRYTAWRIEQDPTLRVIVAAYNQTLAERFSRKIRRIVRDRVPLSDERTAVNEWETTSGGGVRAAGVGGGITGMGGRLIVIDDPVKSREEADSPTYRDRVWEWYTDDLYTRREPGASIVLIMCMTGDTPVLLPDGTTRPLSQILPGDNIATYDNGDVSTSTVLNWVNQGPDKIYEVRTMSGRRVRANARHPFRVIQENGYATWVRLESLRVGMRVRSVEAPIQVSSAASKDAVLLQSARDSVCPTTAGRDTPTGIDRHQRVMLPVAPSDSRGGTGSPLMTTSDSLLSRTVGAPFADNSLTRSTGPSTGPRSSASITITPPEPCADCCATIATSSLDERIRSIFFEQPSSTWSIGTDEIVEIVDAGIEDVFDIEVERTHNFIANGLEVSNTRWHLDDLAGRILASRDGPNWRVLHLPAIAGVDDPAERAEGEALWPAQYPLDELNRIRLVGDEGERGWWALYQGMPTADDGVIFHREWWDGRNRYDPATLGDDGWLIRRRVIHWDTAEEAHAGAAYSAGVVGDLQELRDTGRFRLLVRAVHRGRWELTDLLREVEAFAAQWRYDPRFGEILNEVRVEYASSGKSVVQTMKAGAPEWLQRILTYERPVVSKDIRGREAAVFCAQDKVLLPWPDASNAGWLAAFEAELYALPSSKWRDQGDAFAMMVRAYRRWWTQYEPRQEQSIAAD